MEMSKIRQIEGLTTAYNQIDPSILKIFYFAIFGLI